MHSDCISYVLLSVKLQNISLYRMHQEGPSRTSCLRLCVPAISSDSTVTLIRITESGSFSLTCDPIIWVRKKSAPASLLHTVLCSGIQNHISSGHSANTIIIIIKHAVMQLC